MSTCLKTLHIWDVKSAKRRAKQEIRDIEYLQLVEEYEELKKKNFKVSYIVSLLGEKYKKSERAIYKIIDRMAKQVVQ